MFQLDRTALQWAAANGHDEVLEMLLKAQADVEAADKVTFFPDWLYNESICCQTSWSCVVI